MSVTSSGSRVTSAWDKVLNQQLSFGYDDMNRLSSRTVTAGSPQSFTYSYDRWGNRTSQVAMHDGPSMSTTFNTTNNQIADANGASYTYDAAGNVTGDGSWFYTYDAEGNLIQADQNMGFGMRAQPNIVIMYPKQYVYTYDALNHRVAVSETSGPNTVTQQFVFNPGGQRVATLDDTGTPVTEQAYLAGAPLAFYTSGSFHFQHQDWLGTERVRTSQTGATEGTASSLPFGDGYTSTLGDEDPAHFTGLDLDGTGSSHAMFRDYSSATGTWMRPDPYRGSYDLSNPQSMNRYAYVMNNPLTLFDPYGLDFWEGGCYYHESSYNSYDQGGKLTVNKIAEMQFCDWMSGGGGGGSFGASGDVGGGTTGPSRKVCNSLNPPSGPINYSASAANNAKKSLFGLYRTFTGGGTQDFKGNSTFGSRDNQIAAGNFNFGASMAARGYSLSTTIGLAGAGAFLTNFTAQAGYALSQSVYMQGQYGGPSSPNPGAGPRWNMGSGFPGFPSKSGNQGDQEAPNENGAVINGYVWQTIGCHS